MEQILKQSPRRTVLLVDYGPEDNPRPRIVKRFHSPGIFAGLMDPLRALREYRALARLRALGVRAPEPQRVLRTKGVWELTMEKIPGAINLESVFAGWACGETHGLIPGRVSPVSLANAVAELLALILFKGIQHPDLHPGNVVLDDQGQLWLVDPIRLRTTSPFRDEASRALLTHLCQSCRETTSPRWRALVMARLRRLSQSELPEGLFNDLDQIETAARLARRNKGRKRIARWQRVSSACTQRGKGWVALEREPGIWRRTQELPPADALSQWNALGHLAEHRIPAERPVLFWPCSKGVRLVTQIPAGTRPLENPSDASPAAWGQALGTIHDRGLQPNGEAQVRWWLTPSGAILAGGTPLKEQGPELAPDVWPPLANWKKPDWSPIQEEEFRRTWKQAQRCGGRNRLAHREARDGQL